MDIVHGLGPDKETCRCGLPWPCAGWLAQQSDMVMDRIGRQAAMETYAGVA